MLPCFVSFFLRGGRGRGVFLAELMVFHIYRLYSTYSIRRNIYCKKGKIVLLLRSRRDKRNRRGEKRKIERKVRVVLFSFVNN